MEPNNVVQATTETPDETPLESLATPEAVDSSTNQELKEKNTKLFARAKKAEEERKELREKLVAYETKEKTGAQTPAPTEDEITSVLELRSKGYSDAEVLTVRRYAKKLGLSVPDALKDPAIEAYVERERSKAKVEQATPAPSARTSVTINEKSWGELTPKERSENVGEAFKKATQGGGRNSNE